jgi:hypothetical protein
MDDLARSDASVEGEQAGLPPSSPDGAEMSSPTVWNEMTTGRLRIIGP